MVFAPMNNPMDNSTDEPKYDPWQTLFTRVPPKDADTIVLVLTSQGIDHYIEKTEATYSIRVLRTDHEKAMKTMTLFFEENRFFRVRQQLSQIPFSSFKSYPAFSIMALLCLVHGFAHYKNAHEQLVLKYGSSALYIIQGETFRAVTALFLHADTAHLLGNLAGLLIFAAPLISVSGTGTGLFLLLAAGTAGNLINAYFYQTAHLSIGASTAVMGAAGLLAAYQATRKSHPLKLDNLMPIFAVAILVAMFSQGERTDVWAHIFGFLSGLSLGVVFFPLNRIFGFKNRETAALVVTVGIVFFSWLAGR